MFSLEFWLIFAVILVLGELLTVTFYLLSIAVGSAFAGLVNYLGFDPIVQILVFAVVTIICVILLRPISSRLTKNSSDKKANSDRLIGKEGIVIEKIIEDAMGTVDFIGDQWKAISDTEIDVGEKVIVEKIQGVKLFVRKK
ncbi:NfeD family protein [Methanobrevibacter filiformis]|uniref:NfeD-like C-terminal domain-containing protein n=1 Tax=Methanobrevibacter filiformis TaxID=55758 RepID=A0A166EZC4_9EURY|nr:NfeD family protein [Methanobrevibacter filiformis]KZX17166.1 hypothetical protein MBFIL_03290 [Methanobrevibacter filiformis]